MKVIGRKLEGEGEKRLEYLLPCVLLGYSLAMGVSSDENHSSNGEAMTSKNHSSLQF